MKIHFCDNKKNIIGERVRDLRKSRNWTQKDLAAKLEVTGLKTSEVTILRIEKDERLVTDFEVVKLAEIFGISTDELLLGKKSK
ncbi:MAG: helix-turn-helix transcriptional regulator [Oscillospiraceae bacterium]